MGWPEPKSKMLNTTTLPNIQLGVPGKQPEYQTIHGTGLVVSPFLSMQGCLLTLAKARNGSAFNVHKQKPTSVSKHDHSNQWASCNMAIKQSPLASQEQLD
jgi:hypothetical protein